LSERIWIKAPWTSESAKKPSGRIVKRLRSRTRKPKGAARFAELLCQTSVKVSEREAGRMRDFLKGPLAVPFVVADEVDNYPHEETRKLPREHRKTTMWAQPPMWAWFNAERLTPPQDGSEIVILANLISDYGDGEVDVRPICARVRWIAGAWVDGEGMAIAHHPESQRLVILHFTPAPAGD
jgi:hypothetical protein